MGGQETNFIKAWHRVNKLWVKTLVYSWIILICALIFHFVVFNKRDLLYAFFPVIFDEYWFITSYIVLILLTPILNIAIRKFDRKNLLILIGILIVFADIVPFIKNDGTPNAPLGNMFSVGAMLSPYLIGAFIHRYEFKLKMWQACAVTLFGAVLEYTWCLLSRFS